MTPKKYLIKTPRDKAFIASSRLRDRVRDFNVVMTPEVSGYQGLVMVESDQTLPEDEIRLIPEVEQVIPIEIEAFDADLETISQLCLQVAEQIPDGATFAVKATRRGSHDFTSKAVEEIAGAAILGLDKELRVALNNPDYVIKVEIIQTWAGVALLPGSQIHQKKRGKEDSRELTRKVTLVQLVYESKDLWGTKRIAASLGRSAQAFEVKRFVAVMDSPVNSPSLQTFLNGLEEGLESRLSQQKRTYGGKIQKVPLKVYEIYQMLRSAKTEKSLVIMTDPRGKTLPSISQELCQALNEAKDIYLFNGSNEGIPPGCFSLADYTIDLAPYMTYGTDQAIAASMIGLLNVWHDY
jgi:tRNA acetyltransferase TAN1